MFAIGEFARHGRVSVRMLRHYDAIGLLEPVRVDPATGYRFYDASQLSRLNRIVVLKELGFTLQQVASILNEQVGTAELRGMLMLRRAELQQRIATDAARLTQVEARMAAIENEAAEPPSVVVKPVEAVRVAELTGLAAGYEPRFITPVIQPLYRELEGLLCAAAIDVTGPGIAYYEDAGDEAITVHAALPIGNQPVGDLPIGDPPGREHGFGVVALPRIPAAATLVHCGSMDHVLPSIQALARWIDASGYTSLGYAREVTLTLSDNPDDWVTELAEPVQEASLDVKPEITRRAAQPYAGISSWVTMAAIASIADRIPEIFGWLGARGIAPAGPPFFRYLVVDMARQLQVEVGVPVAAAIEDDGEIRAATLPAGRFAVMTHTGAPDTLAAATGDLLAWAQARGLTWDMSRTDEGERWGCRVEFYLTNPAEQPDPSKWQTQLAFRLAD